VALQTAGDSQPRLERNQARSPHHDRRRSTTQHRSTIYYHRLL